MYKRMHRPHQSLKPWGHKKKITERIYIIGKEGSLQRNDNDRKDVSKILHSDVSKILNSNL